MKHLISLTCIINTLTVFLYAQEYPYVRYTEKDGLPSSTVYHLAQDKDGFIWFATENGICRFDGTNYKTYTTKDGLPDNAILKIHVEKNGRIWVIPFTHYPYYFKDEKFYPIDLPDSSRQKLTSTISINSSNKHIYINAGPDGSNTYFYTLDKRLISLSEYFNISNKKLTANGFIDDTTISAGHEDSVFWVYQSRATFINKTIKEGFFLKLSRFAKDTVINGRINLHIYPKGFVNDSIFLGESTNYLLFFDSNTGSLIFKIKNNKATYALIDSEGNVWVSTLGFGVFRYPSLNFTHTSPGKSENEIFSIAEFSNKLLLGANFSILYSSIPDSFIFNPFDYSTLLQISGNIPAQVSKQNRIFCQIVYNQKLYIGSDAFLIKKEKSGKEIIKNIYPVKDISVENDKLLVSLGRSVLLLSADDLSVKDTLLNQRATAGAIYNNDYIIGTIGGLIKINSVTKKITSLTAVHPALSKRITNIKKGNQNDLWIATSGAGLVHFKDDKVIRTITEENGLTSDICTSLFIDSNIVWAGTNKGLNKITITRDSFIVTPFTTADGLASDIINAVYADTAKVYVGSPAGLTTFTKRFTKENSICRLHILGALVNSKSIQLDSSYTFSYKTLNIRFDFVAISFKSAGKIKYYYQLEGLDDKWNTTTETYINFATLPPGVYTLKIKAENKFGVESEVKTIRIRITPPWWITWWFLTLAFIGVSAVIILLYRRRVAGIKKREKTRRETEAQLAALEQQALQAQMNPHFIFNCLNSIQSFIIDNDVQGANRYLTGFASLIRQTLDHSSMTTISIASEIKYLNTYLELERMRFQNKFTYSVKPGNTLSITETYIPAMLLQPFAENAIRHGIQHRKDNNGEISIEFLEDKTGNILCIIADNGVGLKKANELKSTRHIEYQSKGTAITQKRIDSINAQFNTNITVIYEDAYPDKEEFAGTKVSICFPPSFFK